jgi:hypothetical protein
LFLFILYSLVLSDNRLVWSFIFLHTQSLLIASVGMLHIILSFPFAYFFLQVFLDIGGMGLLNFMALFIILGIGADDIFIFVDAWKQSAIVKPRAEYGDGDAGDHDWLTARLDYSCVFVDHCSTFLLATLRPFLLHDHPCLQLVH